MASTGSPKYSLVEFFDQVHETTPPGHCGYCQKNGSYVDGLWAYRLTPTDYQNLLLRGWRRSGKYVYKPVMYETCCPQYGIRCDALSFKVTKSQKKVLKRMHNYLAFGTGEEKNPTSTSDHISTESIGSGHGSDLEIEDDGISGDQFSSVKPPSMQPEEYPMENIDYSDHKVTTESDGLSLSNPFPKDIEIREQSNGNSGTGMEKRQRKAKEIRLERKMLRLAEKGIDPNVALRKKSNMEPASLEFYLSKEMPANPKHVLRTRLVSYPEEHVKPASYQAALELYRKYEFAIHKKSVESSTEKQFVRFLVDSPLLPQHGEGQSTSEVPVFGSFHMEYYLDDKLIAVDVLDVLPDCVTSVYFFYDPDYHFLSLGTYSVLQEIAMIRELNKRYLGICYASLGFYVHSCQKMQYKAKFQPSFLLCPQTYTWHPLQSCLGKLENQRYCRFGGSEDKDTEGEIDDIADQQMLILYRRNLMTFGAYKATVQKIRRPTETALRVEFDRIKQYGRLVGRKCLLMALYCDSAPINSK